MFHVRNASGRVGSISVGLSQLGLMKRSGTSPLVPGSVATMEEQLGQPMKHLQPNQPTVRQIPRETVQRKHELSGRTPESTRKPPGRSHTCRSNPR